METNSSQKVSCVVNYTYDASEADELTIRPGDVLKDIERLPGGWWRGELRGRRGMFPDNFVTVLQEHATNRANTVQGRCRAVFSYLPANPDELPLCVGDVLEVLGEVEEGWWQGRRAGRVGVFPSNFVVMLDPHNAAQQPAPVEPAPALPPKPVKEQCRVLFPYTAVNEDELTLADGDIVTIVSKDAPDRGWWRGEVNGRVGLFPDNFVQLLPAVAQDVEEKKPDRPPSKGSNSIYPVLNKYSEKTSSIKELTTTKLSMHKENTISKESSTQSTVTHTSKSDSEKIIHSESGTDGPDGQVKKPPVPVKKSPTPTSAVTGLFSGLKNKMMSSSDKSEKTSTSISNSSNSSVEGDKTDGALSSKVANTNTFDHVERNSILNDPRASRVKAPRRRPPSQVMRDDSPVSLGLTNGHEASPDKILDKSSDRSSDKSLDKSSEIKPRAREWEKHRAPWMAELKLNQAKKGGLGDRKQHTSTDRIVDCGIEEKRSSHSMEMSKSTSSISSRISVLESSESSFDKIRTSDKKESPPPDLPTTKPPPLTSPTAAGRTLTTMLDEIKKPPAPSPPLASARLDLDKSLDKSDKSIDKSLDGSLDRSDKSLDKSDKVELREKSELKTERLETISRFSSVFNEVEEKGISFSSSILSSSGISPSAERTSTLERRHTRTQEHEGNDALIAQLNNRISNLEKLIEVQNAKFTAAIEELTNKLSLETEKRQTLQSEMEKLAQCVTQV